MGIDCVGKGCMQSLKKKKKIQDDVLTPSSPGKLFVSWIFLVSLQRRGNGPQSSCSSPTPHKRKRRPSSSSPSWRRSFALERPRWFVCCVRLRFCKAGKRGASGGGDGGAAETSPPVSSVLMCSILCSESSVGFSSGRRGNK